MSAFAVIRGEDGRSEALAYRLQAPLLTREQAESSEIAMFLDYRDGCLKLLDRQTLKKGGLLVDVDPRPGEQHSYPAPKKDLLAQAVGKKTRSVVDATAGWAQDSLALFRMGYDVTCIERSLLMAALIQDGLDRLAQKDWVRKRELAPPTLLFGNAITIFPALVEPPECIYLDPMFPAKRKQSAATRKSMSILRDILGDDLDREALFEAAIAVAGKRVVVKSPDYADPLGGKPSESYQGKLLRYDVYLR
jgi:16S rRNA (guanine1516-N2)-methyltransferase